MPQRAIREDRPSRLAVEHTPMDMLITSAVAAVHAAGKVLLESRSRDLAITEKDASRTSIVTLADMNAQAAIVDVILDAFPDHAIVGEEGSAGNTSSRNVWYVDPLDGTSNYSHALPLYCVSIAFCDEVGPSLGVIFDPCRNDMFIAQRGRGATRNGESISVAETSALRSALVTTQVQSDDPAMLDNYVTRVRALAGQSRAVRALGTPALSLAYIACGWLDAYCEPNMSPWDTLAGALLVEEAGGTVTTFGGRPRPVGRISSILASNGKFHGDILRILADEAAQYGERA
jgi:myo-inositol-1(or 4)-monophosphatase